MSKASEWAKGMEEFEGRVIRAEAELKAAELAQPESLTFTVERNNGVRVAPSAVAYVRPTGELSIGAMGRNHLWLSAVEAIALAHWILETFEDKP